MYDEKTRPKKKDKDPLFLECVNALGKGVIIYSTEKSEERYCSFQKEVPFTFYGRIEWDTAGDPRKYDSGGSVYYTS